ncbi:transcriptional regulator family: Fungal Specific TF [Aspergillus niger]|nr:transcriptional regulator family: Fungal Specific TF [Aspergillus niger]
MHPTGRKRRVTTCVPCYTRKQRCNRQYPCNHCTRRRRPEECVYQSIITGDPSNTLILEPARDPEPQEPPNVQLPNGSSKASPAEAQNSASNSHSSLAKSFGYFEHSDSNTMALLKKWDLDSEGDTDQSTQGLSTAVLETVKQVLEKIPPRPILDFLMQYFVDELNWMKQIIHPPSFLTQYQHWWTQLTSEDVPGLSQPPALPGTESEWPLLSREYRDDPRLDQMESLSAYKVSEEQRRLRTC